MYHALQKHEMHVTFWLEYLKKRKENFKVKAQTESKCYKGEVTSAPKHLNVH
jgi:hypothetical protein